MSSSDIHQPKQPKTNVDDCDYPYSDSFSDLDMNSGHIHQPKQPTTNVDVCNDPSSDSASEVDADMNSVHIPKSSYDQSSDAEYPKSNFQNCPDDKNIHSMKAVHKTEN